MTFEFDPICTLSRISEPFLVVCLKTNTNTGLMLFILLTYQYRSPFIQNYTKILICIFIAVMYTLVV